ncbi:choloylglycine hydrolase family protein [Halosquirtibacter xylanolyticus]|uniref:linear amide C-N hydrolase n=1 Tax=Halosquirtibacter xylanolyticus TaxID=3374599 RepID=UPI00374A1FF6|nr:choloylglycine hydrolase family protein [Prolixibacteraceae bacterium]
MKQKLSTILILMVLLMSQTIRTNACTGVKLIAENGDVIYGRTMEWGAFDLNSRVAIVPQGYTFNGHTPDGNNGMTYTTKYGFVALDMLGKDLMADGMNEKGLSIGLFYHPGYAVYPKYNKKNAKNTISSQEVANYILGSFATIKEVKQGMAKVEVVGVVEEAIGITVQAHWMVTDKTGNSIVIEYTGKKLKIHDAPLGVITNAPNYDWHMTNLSNYLNISMFSLKPKTLDGVKFTPIGAGSGMIGLPGDNTPPSRFIRAVAWSHTTRPLPTGQEAVYELFRILDNFNLPLGPDGAEGAEHSENSDHMRSSTIWTTAWNHSDMTLNFHTQHNRRVQFLDMKEIDFANIDDEIIHIDITAKEQDIHVLKPRFN